MILAQTSGCWLVGERYLDDEWGLDYPPLQLGVQWPFGLRTDEELGGGTWAISVQALAALGIEFDGSVSELSVGAWISPWANGKWVSPLVPRDFEPSTLTYAGGGLSYVSGALEKDGTRDSDNCLGAYIHCGVRRTFGSSVALAVEVRYTFGTKLHMHGETMDADGFQVMVEISPSGSSLWSLKLPP